MASPAPRIGGRKEQERSTRTRRRLLDATVDCLVEVGYAGTTTHEVARRAGVTRGALLHHYPTKQELVTAAVAHLDWLRLLDFQQRFAELGPEDDPVDRVVEILWELMHDRRAYADLELQIAARTDPELHRVHMAGSARRIELAEREQHESIGLRGDETPEARILRNFVFNQLRGLAIAVLFEPDPAAVRVHLDLLKQVARSVLERARR